MKRFGLVFLVLAGIFSGCDFVDPPYLEVVEECPLDETCQQKIPVDPFTSAPVRKVLFEEYTGHKCVNCPEASELAYQLASSTFKDQAILVSVHATGLAEPDPNSSKYNVDYTTEAGDEYMDFFNVFAVPLGLLNRQQKTNGAYFYVSGEWQGEIENILQEPAEVQIHITPCYDAATRDVKIVSDIRFIENATDQEYMTVWLVEDSVTGWQKDRRRQPQDVENYTFHDLFRGSLNGPWGQPLTAEGSPEIRAGDSFRERLCYTIPPEYDVEHCKILVFVHNFATREVRQVEEVHVTD